MEKPTTKQGTELTFVIPDTESLGHLKAMSEDFSLTLKYKNADEWAALKDQEVRAFYMGIKEVPNEKGELVLCGVFVSDKECFIAGQKLILDAVRQLPSKTPVAIIYRGKKTNKSTEGSTMIFDVHTLK